MTSRLGRAVILAGGGGKRLWPWAGPDLPKPLLPLGGGGRSLLAAALDRIEPLVGRQNVMLQAPSALAARLAATEPRISSEHCWDEPSARDTGPAVALAMRRLAISEPEAIAAVLPADHRVADEAAFRGALEAAAAAAEGDALVVLGVAPDRPSTAFGYVEAQAEPATREAVSVRRFVEKPDTETARKFLAAGRFFWNAGVFVWRVSAFWAALERHRPELAQAVDAYVGGGDAAAWERAPRLSIDYGLMERAERVSMVPLDAGWDDVGGWEAVLRLVDEGDAGPARRLPVRAAVIGSAALAIGDTPRGEVLIPGDTPLLLVFGPGGVLAAPRGAADRVKALLS